MRSQKFASFRDFCCCASAGPTTNRRTQIDQSWHDVEDGDCTEQSAGEEARQMSILPDREIAEPEVNDQRQGRENQPEPCRSVSPSQRTRERINQSGDRKSSIQSRATRAHAELMSREMK